MGAGKADIFVLKLDPGRVRMYGAGGSATFSINPRTASPPMPQAMLSSPDGLTVCWTSAASRSISTGGGDAFLVKLETGGGHVWSKRFGNVDAQLAEKVAVDAAGNVLVAGYFHE